MRDPIIDSELFQRALMHVLLKDRDTYRLITDFLVYKVNISALATQYQLSEAVVYNRLRKGKDLIRDYLERYEPYLAEVRALRSSSVEDLSRKELEELEEKFPFVDPAKNLES